MLMSKDKKGVSLIKKNVDKFQNIISDLAVGIDLCNIDIAKNNLKIQALTEESSSIDDTKNIATAFKANLSSMLKTPALDKGIKDKRFWVD